MSDNHFGEKDATSNKEPDYDTPVTRKLQTDQLGDRYVQSRGVNNIEALRAAAKSSAFGKRMLWVIGICVEVVAFAYAIQASTR